MIAVPGFPRALYPPDAAAKGKRASTNGPDVEAYKRVVWRLGRWPGPASGFDRAFSDQFSHGRSGNVSESGVAGMQRQAKIDDTGWIGQTTFNLMRSVKIPDGLPGAGDYAMDAYAQSLIVEAWDQFGGSEPPPEPKQTVRKKALSRATAQLGVKEDPPGSNVTPYTDWYGMVGPWCAMFTTWAYVNAATDIGALSVAFVRGINYAYVPYIVNDARFCMNGLKTTKDPIPGDLVCYDWHRDGTFDHVGLFERWTDRDKGAFDAIEGNTSTSSDSDGGEVMRRRRSLSDAVVVFVRVAEA